MNTYGLIGLPLSHSFSQTYFTQKLQKENIWNSRFDLFPLEQIKAFPLLLNSQKNLRGLAVTIPYKETIIPYLDVLDEVSLKIGAVNCIAFTAQGLKGCNTDVIGFEKSISPLIKSHHKKALVLGSGGASKAVAYILAKLGIEYIIVSRKENLERRFISYKDINESIMRENLMIVNCSPVGQFPDVHECPQIPYEFISSEHLVYDLVYNPLETQFLKSAQRRGAVIKNGMEMLEIQAEENWKLWNQH